MHAPVGPDLNFKLVAGVDFSLWAERDRKVERPGVWRDKGTLARTLWPRALKGLFNGPLIMGNLNVNLDVNWKRLGYANKYLTPGDWNHFQAM